MPYLSIYSPYQSCLTSFKILKVDVPVWIQFWNVRFSKISCRAKKCPHEMCHHVVKRSNNKICFKITPHQSPHTAGQCRYKVWNTLYIIIPILQQWLTAQYQPVLQYCTHSLSPLLQHLNVFICSGVSLRITHMFCCLRIYVLTLTSDIR